MPFGSSSYGEGAVRLVRVLRGEGRDRLMDVSVEVRFGGDVDAALVAGAGPGLPTAPLRDTVYALAKDADGVPEHFGRQLVDHFLAAETAPRPIRVELTERPWQHVDLEGRAHPHAFIEAGSERRFAAVTGSGGDLTYEGGIRDLRLLKTRGSASVDLPATLPDSPDRLLATLLSSTWRYRDGDVAFDAAYAEARRTLLETFAGHDSGSVRQTVIEMGDAVLAVRPEIAEITIQMPDKHHLVFDLGPFGLPNEGEVYYPIDEPYGIIEGTVVRG